MTTLTLDTPAIHQSATAQPDLAGLPLNLRVSHFTFGLLSSLGPNHFLFLPLSIIAICSGLVNYSWQREIALRGEEINRGIFLHTGGDPRLTQQRNLNPGLD